MFEPIPATASNLNKILARDPIVWVGAGASIAAGYPSTQALVTAMKASAEDTLAGDDYIQVASQFVASMGRTALAALLDREIGAPRPPTEFHQALARLAKAGLLHCVITTNYDSLLERALEFEGVRVTLQIFNHNEALADRDSVRLIKVHGSRGDWKSVVLDADSYEAFSRRYQFLETQLDVLSRQHPLLFVGSSLQDPRLLGWLARQPQEVKTELHPWRALMTEGDWRALEAFTHQGRAALEIWSGVPLRPVIVPSHAEIPRLWIQAADEQAPLPKPPARETLRVEYVDLLEPDPVSIARLADFAVSRLPQTDEGLREQWLAQEVEICWPPELLQAEDKLVQALGELERRKEPGSRFHGLHADSAGALYTDGSAAIRVLKTLKSTAPKRVPRLWAGMIRYFGAGGQGSTIHKSLARFLTLTAAYAWQNLLFADALIPPGSTVPDGLKDLRWPQIVEVLSAASKPFLYAAVDRVGGQLAGFDVYGPEEHSKEAWKDSFRGNPIVGGGWFAKYLIPQCELDRARHGDGATVFDYREEAFIRKLVTQDGKELPLVK